MREFDVEKKEFVTEDAFLLPEAKSRIAWKNKDTLFVGTDFGEGSMTDSGYPRIIKEWKRGTPLTEAETLLEGTKEDVSVYGGTNFSADGNAGYLGRHMTFYTAEQFVITEDGEKAKLNIQDDANFDAIFAGDIILRTKSDWELEDTEGKKVIFTQGSLLALAREKVTGTFTASDIEVLYKPDERSSIQEVNSTRSTLLVRVLDNVRTKLFLYTREDGKWSKKQAPFPEEGTLYILSTNPWHDQIFLVYQNFLEPASLYLMDAKTLELEKIKSQPERFDASPYAVVQQEATSKDGTEVPYFLVSRKDMKKDGTNPTLLYGYGGFEVSMLPAYSATTGKFWLENGGVYVLANIRGGAEFGPQWHQAAQKENRQKCFDDFIAVAEHVIEQKVTSPEHLGIEGGSNGGLLVGATFLQRPDLFNAVVCLVPLLDMIRYSRLLAGASWVGEYGDPEDPEMRKVLLRYSPYHNIRKEEKYPPVFFLTSTKDDRVHPAHARKMVARMKESGHPVYYYENIEGGHGGASNNKQRARMVALKFAYLLKQLKP